jgi:hypothetical protein
VIETECVIRAGGLIRSPRVVRWRQAGDATPPVAEVETVTRCVYGAIAVVLLAAATASAACLDLGIQVANNGSQGGVVVIAENPNGFGAKFLRVGDVILAINGHLIRNVDDYNKALNVTPCPTHWCFIVYEPDFDQFVEFCFDTAGMAAKGPAKQANNLTKKVLPKSKGQELLAKLKAKP